MNTIFRALILKPDYKMVQELGTVSRFTTFPIFFNDITENLKNCFNIEPINIIK